MKYIDTPTKLKAWRKKLGVTQAEAAELLCTTVRHIQRLEAVNPDIKMKRDITPATAKLAAYILKYGNQ